MLNYSIQNARREVILKFHKFMTCGKEFSTMKINEQMWVHTAQNF